MGEIRAALATSPFVVPPHFHAVRNWLRGLVVADLLVHGRGRVSLVITIIFIIRWWRSVLARRANDGLWVLHQRAPGACASVVVKVGQVDERYPRRVEQLEK